MSLIKSSKNVLTKWQEKGFLLAFVIFIVVGWGIAPDFGITWDEGLQLEYAQMIHNYVFYGDDTVLTHRDRYHGPLIELALFWMGKYGPFDSTQGVFIMRHRMLFLLFCGGLFAFYRLLRRALASPWIAAAGTAFLALSPRIFAHSFNNTKDIPFMVLFIMAILAHVRLIKKPSWKRAFIAGLILGLAMSVRVLSLYVPIIALIALIYDRGWQVIRERQWQMLMLTVTISTLVTTTMTWPTLWQNPLRELFNAVVQMSQYPWSGTVLFKGQFVSATTLPWDYLPTWITITNSPILLLLTVVGIAVGSRQLRREKQMITLVMLLWLCLPLVTIYIGNPTLYDGWRHVYFIFPSLVYFSALTLDEAAQRPLLTKPVIAVSLILIVHLLWQDRQLHPLQNVYFNVLAGPRHKIGHQFELDYWGGSFARGFREILKTDQRQKIRVAVTTYPGYINRWQLSDKDQRRLEFVQDFNEADYILTNFRWQPRGFPLPVHYEWIVDGMRVFAVYKGPNFR